MRYLWMIILVVLAIGLASFAFIDDCGDGICKMDEVEDCPDDCSPEVIVVDVECGDSICDFSEGLKGTCPEDCRSR